jgi:hypothetical protein
MHVPRLGAPCLRAVWASLGLAVFGAPSLAMAQQLTASQAADGSMSITLTGTSNCAGFTSISGTPSVSGSSVSITTLFANPGPPCLASPTPVVYSGTVNIGHLGDGSYAVTWSFVSTPPPVTTASFTAQFTLANGLLVPPVGVPTLSSVGYAALAGLLAFFARRSLPTPG